MPPWPLAGHRVGAHQVTIAQVVLKPLGAAARALLPAWLAGG